MHSSPSPTHHHQHQNNHNNKDNNNNNHPSLANVKRDLCIFAVLVFMSIVAIVVMVEFDSVIRLTFFIDDEQTTAHNIHRRYSSSSSAENGEKSHMDSVLASLHKKEILKNKKNHDNHQQESSLEQQQLPHEKYYLNPNFGNTHEDIVRLHLLHLDLFERKKAEDAAAKHLHSSSSNKKGSKNNNKKNKKQNDDMNETSSLIPTSTTEDTEEDDDFVEFHPTHPAFRTEWVKSNTAANEAAMGKRFDNWDRSHPVPALEKCSRIRAYYKRKKIDAEIFEEQEKIKRVEFLDRIRSAGMNPGKIDDSLQTEEKKKNGEGENNNEHDEHQQQEEEHAETTTSTTVSPPPTLNGNEENKEKQEEQDENDQEQHHHQKHQHKKKDGEEEKSAASSGENSANNNSSLSGTTTSQEPDDPSEITLHPPFINNTVLQPVFFSNPRPKIAILTMHSVQVTSDSSSSRVKVQRASLIPLMWYCKSNRYDLIVEDHDIVDSRRAPAWSKVRALRKWLHHYEWVIWVDMDVIMTNHDQTVESFIMHRENVILEENEKKLKAEREHWHKLKKAGGKAALALGDEFKPPRPRPLPHIIIGNDWNGINSGITMWRNSTFTQGFVKRMWGVPRELAQPFWDQGAMKYLLYRGIRGRDEKAADYDYSHLDITDEVNRYPIGLLLFGRNHDHIKWKEGNWLVHFASCKFFKSCIKWMNYFSTYVACAWGAPVWGDNVTMAKPFYRTDIPDATPPPMNEPLEPYPTQLRQFAYHTPKRYLYRLDGKGETTDSKMTPSTGKDDNNNNKKKSSSEHNNKNKENKENEKSAKSKHNKEDENNEVNENKKKAEDQEAERKKMVLASLQRQRQKMLEKHS